MIERFSPIACGILTVILLYLFREKVVAEAISKEVDFGNLYSSVFDWSSIQTGFLFGIFGYIAGKSDGFIASIRNTEEMTEFLGYQKRAMLLGFLLTFASIPMMVTNLSFDSSSSLNYWLFTVWAALAVWAFLAFLRVAYIFGIVIKTRDQTRIAG
jgi:hypothetical protein